MIRKKVSRRFWKYFSLLCVILPVTNTNLSHKCIFENIARLKIKLFICPNQNSKFFDKINWMTNGNSSVSNVTKFLLNSRKLYYYYTQSKSSQSNFSFSLFLNDANCALCGFTVRLMRRSINNRRRRKLYANGNAFVKTRSSYKLRNEDISSFLFDLY